MTPNRRATPTAAPAPPSTTLLSQAPPLSNLALVRRLLGFAWRYRGDTLRVLAQQAVLVALSLSGLGLVGLAIDFLRHAVSPNEPPAHWPLGLRPPETWPPARVVLLLAGLLLALAILRTLLRYRAALTLARLAQRMVVQLRAEVYDKLQRLSFRFFDANESGAIINRVASDAQAVRMFVDAVLIQMLIVTLSLAVYLTYMLSVHVWLTLACLATTPALWIVAVLFSRKVRPMYRRGRELSDDLVRVVTETVQGAQVVKGFGGEEQRIAIFRRANQAVLEQKEEIFRQLARFQPTMGGLTQFNMLILIGYGGYLVIQGELPLGLGLFVFANLLQEFATQIGQITNIANTIQSSLTGAQRVFEVLDAPVEVASPPNPVPLPRPRGELTLENIRFGYRPGQFVLDGINLTIQAGECLALVGATGAGKSTLLSLLARFHDPESGRVLFDGVDLRDLDLEQLRRQMGFVFQESFVFSNTVAANIAFGRPEATLERIERAAKIAAADSFIRELPDGYDSVIGEYGANLSGGQRQRLALARAVLLDPVVLFLDDPTAAVDPHTEQEILVAMDNAMRGRTTVLIAHRMSSLRRADRIAVLENGRLVQFGTHDELMRQPGHYRNVARMQLDDVDQAMALSLEEEQSR